MTEKLNKYAEYFSLYGRSLDDCEQIQLGNIATITTGCQYPQIEVQEEDEEPLNVVEQINEETIILSETKSLRVSERKLMQYKFRRGDIILVHNTSFVRLGMCVIFDLPQLVLHTKYLRIIPTKHITNQFLFLMLNKLRYEGKFHELARQKGEIFYVNVSDLKKIVMPVPSIEYQQRIVWEFHAWENV